MLVDHLLPLEQLQISQGVAQGYLTARQGKEHKVRAANRQLIRKAHPEERIYIEP
ncbi:MAG TPA: hypothetical protein VKA53_10800 [Thermoanaerobaculia bacterium]|nr:hypothetical protein [Thermoanaerobaculia bacterium]